MFSPCSAKRRASDKDLPVQSFKFGQTQNTKELDKNAILKFLKTQNKEITNLDMTNWTRNLHFDDKIDVFACLRNCKKLNNLKIHIEDVELYQSDQSHILEH